MPVRFSGKEIPPLSEITQCAGITSENSENSGTIIPNIRLRNLCVDKEISSSSGLQSVLFFGGCFQYLIISFTDSKGRPMYVQNSSTVRI